MADLDPLLKSLEQKSIYVLREAKAQFKNPALLCSFGKDSTTLVHITSKAFPKFPFPVLHLDTELKFSEIYEFRDKLQKIYGFELIIAKNEEGIRTTSPEKDRFECCMKRKTEALKMAIKEYGFDALILAIRRDELPERGIERYFSPRKEGKWEVLRPKKPEEEGDAPFEYLQDAEFDGWYLFAADWSDPRIDHYRVHPMLHWTELDVWRYIKAENIPVNPLYFSSGGIRFRSLGCKPCVTPIESTARTVDEIIEEIKQFKGYGERAGRAQDKEKLMRRLRALGYM